MFENTSFNNDYNDEIDKRGSILNITNALEQSEFKDKGSLTNRNKGSDRDNARNSQVVLNFLKSDEDNNLEDEEFSMFDEGNSFIVYEKDKHEKRKNDKAKY
jgi:hypothetical protein